MGQSLSLGRPVPQVRHERQFRLKVRSQQRYLANDPENRTPEPRGEWNCVSLHRTRS